MLWQIQIIKLRGPKLIQEERSVYLLGTVPNMIQTPESEVELYTVEIIENAQRHFQGSLLGCFEYVPYTALTIVCTINVSIDCKKNKVSNPVQGKIYLIENQSNEMLGLCFVLK